MTKCAWSLWLANAAPHSCKFAFTFAKSLCVTGQLIADIHPRIAGALPRSELPAAAPLVDNLPPRHILERRRHLQRLYRAQGYCRCDFDFNFGSGFLGLSSRSCTSNSSVACFATGVSGVFCGGSNSPASFLAGFSSDANCFSGSGMVQVLCG
jgi:hypothetical protein